MNEVTIVLPGDPIPLKRPQISYKRMYDPQARLKQDLSWLVKEQLPPLLNPTTSDFTGPFSLTISFFMPIPRTFSNRIKEKLNNSPHYKKPDIDNLLKFYLDVCNGILYNDDSQIYSITTTKTYSDHTSTIITAHYLGIPIENKKTVGHFPS